MAKQFSSAALKKFVAVLCALFLAAMMLITLSACSGEEPAPSGDGGKKFPTTESDGFTQTYNGGYTSIVHRVENEENGNSIYGRIFTKDDIFDESEKYPLLIMSHGYNSVSMDARNGMAQYALDSGMVVYTFDFCGGGKMSKSEGEITEMSVETEISDLESVLNETSALPYVDSSRVALFGHSFGGLVSALTAARNSSMVAGLVLHAPALGGVVNKDNSPYTSVDEIPETVQNGALTVGKVFYEDMWDLYPYEEIKSFDKYVYIMNGSEDRDQTPTQDAYNERTVPASPSCEMHIVEGAGHDFNASQYLNQGPDLTAYLTKAGVLG